MLRSVCNVGGNGEDEEIASPKTAEDLATDSTVVQILKETIFWGNKLVQKKQEWAIVISSH